MTLGNKPYHIEYLSSVVREDVQSLSPTIKETIKRSIEERLVVDPVGFGKPLRYNFKGYRRLRIGDYRVVFPIEVSTHTVIIVAIKHQKDIYKYLNR